MNKPFFYGLFSLLMCLTLPLAATAQVVDIPDPNLRATIETALGKASGATITIDEMARLTHLDARETNISDLTGLEHATNLTELNLGGNNLSNISPLAGLTNLRRLWLWSNDITDISPVAGLTNLIELILQSNAITDLSPVSGLTNLTGLWLSYNKISDLSPLVANMGLGSGDRVFANDNPLSFVSIKTHIPALQSRGVTVEFDDTTHLNAGQPREVRLIYFLPSDRPYRPEVVQLMKDRILQVQTFFAEQMEAHGYGNKTFRVETDASGEPMVHRVDGQYPDHHYSDYWGSILWTEIGDVFNRYTNIYRIVPDTINPKVGDGSRLGKNAGTGVIGSDVNFTTAAHDLGHAFGLWHDFRDGSYLMSYGPGSKDRLSACHAEYLAVHPYFNPDTPIEEGPPPTIELISPRTYPADAKSIPVRLKVSDSDGVHQVILHLGPPDNRNRITVKACRGLGGKKEAVVQFDYDGVIPFAHNLPYSRSTSLKNPLVHPIFVEAVDTNGNVGEQFFFLSSDMYQPSSQSASHTLSKISGDNQQGLPNTPLAQPFVIEVRDPNGFTFGRGGVQFAVTAGGGTLSKQLTKTDGEGTAYSTLTLGPHLGTNTVEVSVSGIEGTVTFTAVAVTVSGAAIKIPDLNLRAAVEDALKKAPGTPITTMEMGWLTHLEAKNANISDLTGLEHATNLTELLLGGEWVDGEDWVQSNSISDLTPLSGLMELTRLELRGNNISDISPLAGLTNLKRLSFEDNKVSDLLPLAGLTNLTDLSLEFNNITDISVLSRLTNLTWLALGYNAITDHSILPGLTNLTWLDLRGTNTSDLSVLSGLTNLTALYIDSNGISNLSPLLGLTDLTRLALNGNSISDLSPLAGLTNLKWMRLARNNISDLSPLVANAGLGSGDEVVLNDNPLSFVSINTHVPALQSRGVTVEYDADETRPPDVNGDGVVNVLDLVVIASELGNTGQNLAADVNGDEVVNILDLILVAGMFEDTAAAPAAQSQIPEALTAVEVQDWLTDARTLEIRDPIMKRGFVVLEQLLVALTPTETALLPNYPNPFNPETWIPYRLAEDAFVALTIYDLRGRVVRTLNVGHRIASAYESRSKAIYWDGRNDVGEQVVSGVYFYILTAGDYSATRRMVILK